MKDYRRLTEDELLQLKSQSCLADDWGNVSVAEGFNCEYVHHTRFSGEVKLGVFEAEFTLQGGIKKHSGLRHVTLHNVSVGDNCCIENIQNYIANYEIGSDTFIENVDIAIVIIAASCQSAEQQQAEHDSRKSGDDCNSDRKSVV